ncbi:MAG: transposase, partial [Alphaproteobacteria bacterium]|nr:transposase [Alphaproteobacteria bacterium]
PKLPPHRVMVVDNATFHKRKDTQSAILNAGHTLEYLPLYSPDLNPIISPGKGYQEKDTLFNQ